ncbi:hypothetical protein H8356DRAFT_1287380 [Neocallimastix lanati (nom. inval.)]|nr:hypothetical protein H8356DRAFT_1287380 [Neocallimastix sp. JGI-2020a]
MNEIKKNIIIYFNYKDKYCIEDTINYKFFQKNVKVKDEENLIKNKRYCYQWNKRNNCYIENILSFSNEQTYSIPQISQMLGCISCCKDCLNGAYIYDLQSLKSKSISNTIQNTNSYKIITFRNKRNSTDYPILYHNKNQEIRYCLLENTNSLCSKTYTCYPVIPQNLIANELNKDVSKFSNVLYIILSIVFVIIIIGLIWAIFYVIRTYRRHKKINQVIDITGGDNYKGENEDKNENQEEKVYLSNNFDYCYDPSKLLSILFIKIHV